MPPSTKQQLFTTPNGAVVDATSGSLVTTAPGTINTQTLTPQPSYNFQSPNQTPVYPVGAINSEAPMQTTGQEQKQISLSDQLQNLNSQLLGQSEFRTQQQQAQGLPELQKTQNELNSRLTSLKNEAQAIPLQLQQDATGRGVTAGGLRPIETAALRNNAIQALSTSSLLEASRGNLTLAQDMAEKAVAQRFDPIKEQIAVAQANLDLILKDPRTSLQDKNRAAQQKAVQDQRAIDIKTQEDNTKTIQGLALQALQNGAPTAVVNGIMKAQDLAGAFTAAQGYAQKETAQSIQEYNFAARNGYKGSFSQYQNEDANRKAVIAKAGAAGIPYQVITQVDKLSSSFDSSPIVKNYNEVQNKKLSVDAILNTGIKGPADLALVFEFMKALDPTSVVRETEYANAANSGNIFAGVFARFNGYLKPDGGFLPEKVRADFQSLINSKYKVAQQQYDNLRNETARKIEIKTNQPGGKDYLTDYAATTAATKSTPIEGLRSKYNY